MNLNRNQIIGTVIGKTAAYKLAERSVDDYLTTGNIGTY